MIRSRLRRFAARCLRPGAEPEVSKPAPAPGAERLLAIRDIQLGAVREALGDSRTGTEGLGTAVARLVFELGQAKATIATNKAARDLCTAHSRDCPFQS